MRIDRLELRAVGPFSDVSLDFSQGRHGLHIVCGPNEAGKSSALRALRYALFGFPSMCADNFLHAYANLRVGASLRRSDGTSLAFLRRKAVKNSLLAADNAAPLDEKNLAPFLGGFDSELFARMFAIGHEELVLGGRQVAAGAENVGLLLFAAGAGLADLRAVQKKLEAEADGLYRRKGQNPRINQHLSQLDELRRRLRDAQLPGEQWQCHDQAFRAAQARRAELEQDLATQQTLARRLQRRRQAVPLVADRSRLQSRLAELREVPPLPPRFAEQRVEAYTERVLAQNARQAAEHELRQTADELDKIRVPETLVVLSEAVTRLSDDLGSYRKARRDLPGLVALRDQMRRDAQSLLAEVRPTVDIEAADRFRLTIAQQSVIQRLARRHEAMVQGCETVEKEVESLCGELSQIERLLAETPEPPDVRPLADALREAQSQGDLESELRRVEAERAGGDEALQAALSRLPDWPDRDIARLAAAPFPSEETVARFESSFAAAVAQQERLAADLESARQKRDELRRQSEELELQGDVPTEESLLEARRLRDLGWELVLAEWRRGGADPAPLDEFLRRCAGGSDLAQSFRQAVGAADDVADRLRREAGRVERRAALTAQQRAASRLLDEKTADLEAAGRHHAELDRPWRECFAAANVQPRSPREMRAWLHCVRQILQQSDAVAAGRRAVALLRRRMAEQCDGLAAALSQPLSQPLAVAAATGGSGVSAGAALSTTDAPVALGLWMRRAEAALETAEASIQVRRQAQRDAVRLRTSLADAEKRLAAARVAAADWENQWGLAIEPLGLPPSTTPDCAAQVAGKIADVLARLKTAREYDDRIALIHRDDEAFSESVGQLAAEACPDVATLATEEAAVEMLRRARQSQADRQKRSEWEQRLARFQQQADEAQASEQRWTARLAAMCLEAGCRDAAELPRIEQAAAEVAVARDKLSVLEEQLTRLAPGVSLTQLADEVMSDDADALPGRIAALEEDIRRLEVERDEVQRTLGAEETTLAAMNAGQDAAAAAEEYQEAMARLESDALEYVRVQWARSILRESIDRYRQKSEGPVLHRAGELFRHLTGGSFDGLVVDGDDHGQSVLMGVRPDTNRRVALSGMSEGTADQLYLALRLASVEHYLEGREPVPLVVDDILISFDDERAGRALEVLAELSRCTQVVFFTHHAHLVQLARQRLPDDVLFLHAL